MDAGLRKLFRWLGARGFLERAIVVVTSDHGEELQEHGLIGHGKTLYEEVIHVPLVIKPPTGGDGRLVDEPVSLVDVAPTILDLARLQSPPSFNGTSLCDLLGPPADCDSSVSSGLPRGMILSELLSAPTPGVFGVSHRRALITKGGKVVTSHDSDDGFFDLTDDPGELNPEALSPARRTALQRTLQDGVVRASRNATAPSAAQLDDSRRDQLRRLGYAE